MFLILFTILIAILITLIYRQYTYWERTNIPHEKPNFPLGCFDSTRQRPIGLVISDIYNRYKTKIVGIHMFYKPTILIRDVELIQKIMTADFNSFHDRGLYSDEVNDPMSSNLFTSEGQSWRSLRAKLTPAFSSGKLKGMFGTVNDVADKMVNYLNRELEGSESKTLEMKNILTTYAVDVIGSVIFGLDIDSYSNPNNEFRNVHSMIIKGQGYFSKIYNLGNFICPPISKFMVRCGYKNPILYGLKDMMQRTLDLREKNNITRRDLLQLLIQLRNTGKISGDDDDKVWNVETAAENLKSMSIETITTNAFLFYIAGTETTAATASFTIYELAMYPELLERAQNEVISTLEKYSLKPLDKFTYEAVQDMKFLDLCIMETTRKYPGLPILNRICTQDFHVPDTKYTIEKGTPIMISLFGMHRDPEHFPDPDKYDPERYTEEKMNYNPNAFMPFGEGPRHCIAQRMGKVNSKIAVAKILANFNIATMPRKEVEFIFDTAPVLIPKGGLNLKLSQRK